MQCLVEDLALGKVCLLSCSGWVCLQTRQRLSRVEGWLRVSSVTDNPQTCWYQEHFLSLQILWGEKLRQGYCGVHSVGLAGKLDSKLPSDLYQEGLYFTHRFCGSGLRQGYDGIHSMGLGWEELESWGQHPEAFQPRPRVWWGVLEAGLSGLAHGMWSPWVAGYSQHGGPQGPRDTEEAEGLLMAQPQTPFSITSATSLG